MPRWYLNTYIVAVISTASFASFSALTGYTFAKYMSWGRNLMLVIFLSATMIQTELMIIPWYVSIAKLKWINSYAGMMTPGMITTFGIFVIRQFIAGIPMLILFLFFQKQIVKGISMTGLKG